MKHEIWLWCGARAFRRMHFVLAGVLVLTAASGCATTRQISKAEKAYEAGNHQAVLENFEEVIDTKPEVLNRGHRQDEVAHYRDSQIAYGFDQAKQAEAQGELVHAWIWYIQTSAVDGEREECKQALDEAKRVKQAIADRYMEEASNALARGARVEAATAASQSVWYGNDAARDLFREASQSQELPPWFEGDITNADVQGVVRTDSIERFQIREVFAPYGIPVYFGEPPRYYVSMGEMKVEGTHYTREAPAEFAQYDALFKMSRKAKKKGADAIINVQFWTKRKKPFTRGEFVKFAVLPEDNGDTKEAITRIGDGGLPVESIVAAFAGSAGAESAAEADASSGITVSEASQ